MSSHAIRLEHPPKPTRTTVVPSIHEEDLHQKQEEQMQDEQLAQQDQMPSMLEVQQTLAEQVKVLDKLRQALGHQPPQQMQDQDQDQDQYWPRSA